MKKLFALFLVFAMSFSILAGCGSSSSSEETTVAETTTAEPVELTIMAAASLTEVLAELETAYETENPNVDLVINLASSGELQTQIEQGVAADVFISAAQKQMTALNDESLMVSDSIVDLLINKLVVVVPSDSTADLKEVADILTMDGDYVSMGDPASVPAGQYAVEALTNLGIYDQLQTDKQITLGESVKAVLAYVESGEAACGFVYSTDAATSSDVKVALEVPADSYTTISYPAGVVEASENKDAAQDFLDFLQSDEAVEAFESYGFTMAE